MSAVIAPPAALTFSTSDVLCAPVFLLSTAPVVTALSHRPSTAPATEKASACPVAIPPVLGKLATGDCDTIPATFTYVPNALPVTLCACTAPARRVSADRILRAIVVLLERSDVARQAMLLNVAARQDAVARIHADRDRDVVVPYPRLVHVTGVTHLERDVIKSLAVPGLHPTKSAEPPTPRITSGFVVGRREKRHGAVEGESAAKLGGSVLLPFEVAAAISRRACAGGARLKPQRREVM